MSGTRSGDCQPIVDGDQTIVGSGDEMFAQVIAAYGAPYAARFNAVDDPRELTYPSNPPDPHETDKEGLSASLASTGLVLPLPPTRGLLCTPTGSVPLDEKTADEVRVSLQSVTGGDFDGTPGDDPTYAVVLEDETGTRHTISSDGSECGATITAFRGGVSGMPGDYLLRLLGELS